MTTIIVPFPTNSNGRIVRIMNLAKFAIKRNLTLSNKDQVGTNVIALDAAKRKLLYAKTEPGKATCLIIDINKLESCTVKKEYNSIEAGDLIKNKLHHFLNRIFLKLVFKNHPGSVSLPIFDAQEKAGSNVEQLETIARKWERIVTKLLPVHKKEIA